MEVFHWQQRTFADCNTFQKDKAMKFSRTIKAGGGERGQYIMKHLNDSTVRFALVYPGRLDSGILCRATRAVVEGVDVLHGSLTANLFGARWHLNSTDNPEDYFRFLETEEDPLLAAEEILLLPVDPESKAQLHCTLLQGRDSCCLVVRMSHLVVDGSDGKYLLKKLTEAYNLIAEMGNAAVLPIKNGSRDPEKVYEMISPEDMQKLKRTSVSASNVRSYYPFPDAEPGSRHLVTARIPSEIMAAARSRAKQAGASVNDLMITAAYHAYAKMEGIDPSAPMCMNATMDLRRHCRTGDSEGLCNMSGSFMTLLEHGCTGSFVETLDNISRQTGKIKENPLAGLDGMPVVHALARKAPLGLLLAVMKKVYRTAPVGITNLGNLNCRDFMLGDLIPTGGLCGGPMKKKPGMQISVISLDNTCTLAVVAECTHADTLLLRKTLEDMVQEITEYSRDLG